MIQSSAVGDHSVVIALPPSDARRSIAACGWKRERASCGQYAPDGDVAEAPRNSRRV